LNQKISQIILLDNSEYNLYRIDLEINELKRRFNHKCVVYSILASAKDKDRMDDIFNKFTPHVVFHAAAYKHVNLVEKNKIEALTNNYNSTVILSNLAIKYNVENFTFISTDKAVNPTNIMGASKRLAELFIQKHSLKKLKTIFSIVRFGNVIGSSGSMIPLFQNQIQSGGPITVTDKNVSRYFMTIPEAVDLVLSASKLSTSSDVFILDMGKPLKILNIAKKMIALAGKTQKTEDYPNGDIEIKLIGLRPGEKLHEELFLGDEIFKTSHPQILKVKEPIKNKVNITHLINEFKVAIISDDDDKIRSFYNTLSNI
jgi:FlaA1/EpsC-like NDP-sugar epimerase